MTALPNPTSQGEPALQNAELPADWYGLAVDGRMRPEKFTTLDAAEKFARKLARYNVTLPVAVVECVPRAAFVDPYHGPAAPRGKRGRPRKQDDL